MEIQLPLVYVQLSILNRKRAQKQVAKLAVFPLPIYLLPGGVTKLRIFEPRYIRMVKEASSSGDGFALCLQNESNQFNASLWAAHVHIIDFETLEDGLLGITVQADKLLELDQFMVDEDKLTFAHVNDKAHWPRQQNDAITLQLATELKHTFSQHCELAALYPKTYFDDPNWIVARWLEIIPMSYSSRQSLTEANSYEQATQYLDTVILGNTSP